MVLRRLVLAALLLLWPATVRAQVYSIPDTPIHVICDAGTCGGGSAFNDGAVFTGGSTPVNIFAGVFDDALADASGGTAVAARVTAKRALHINLRDASGAELGTVANPLHVTSTGGGGGGDGAIVDGANATIKATVTGALALKVDGSAVTQPVSGTFWQATQPVSGTFFQATQPISAVSLPLPTLAATSTKQPALGTAGSASADVITVQGIASMTPLAVSGNVTAAQGTAAATTASWPTQWGTIAVASASLDLTVSSATVEVAGLSGKTAVGWRISCGGLTGGPAQLTFEASFDGSTFTAASWTKIKGTSGIADGVTGTSILSLSSNDIHLIATPVPPGAVSVRWRVTSTVSVGTATVVSGPTAAPTLPGVFATVNGTVSAAQSTPAVASQAWMVKVTDGTNVTAVKAASTAAVAADPAVVVAISPNNGVTANAGTNLNTSALALSATQTDRTQKTQITDGTRDGTVKAASTAAVAADTAVVVAVSPNNTVPVNETQINGVAVSTGLGITGTGVQRVTQSQEATYSAGTTTKTATTAGTGVFFSLCGSSTKTVEVHKLRISGTAATAGYGDLIIKRSSTTTSNSNRTTLVNTKWDSTNASSASAIAGFYTIVTTAGTAAGTIANEEMALPSSTYSATEYKPAVVFNFDNVDGQNVILRGVAECMEAAFAATPAGAPSLLVSVVWTER